MPQKFIFLWCDIQVFHWLKSFETIDLCHVLVFLVFLHKYANMSSTCFPQIDALFLYTKYFNVNAHNTLAL